MNEKNMKNGPLLQAPKKKKLPVWGNTIFVILTLVAITCYFVSGKSGESPIYRDKVSLGISKSFLSIPVYIATEQGYFANEGLDITIKEYSSGKLATQDLFGGEVDISTAADMPVINNSFMRKDFHIFATFSSSYHFVKMVARKDNGIEKGADLRGRKVGVNKGTSSHFFLSEFLIYNKLPPSDIEMVNIKTVNMPAALSNNEIDAIAVWQPYSQETKKLLQGKSVELPSSEIYRTTFNFVVMKKFSKEHPKILEKFLRAIDKAALFIRTDKDKSQDIITQRFKIDKDTANAVWDDFNFELSLDQTLLMTWDRIAKWTEKGTLVDKNKNPNYLNYIYMDILDAVKPEAITIIR